MSANYSERHTAFTSVKRTEQLQALVEGHGMTIIEAAEYLDGSGSHSTPQSKQPRAGDPSRHNGTAGHYASDPRRLLR